jgi:hypothetical protein
MAGAALWAAAAAGHAGVLRYCDPAPQLSAEQHDRLLRFGAVVKDELERTGLDTAIIARSGLDLSRFGYRYSHAGVSLKASPDTPWSVRQLYYACDERRPRIYDQGMAAFLLGTENPALGYVSAVLLPPQAAAGVERAVLDKQQALQMLGTTYSANAYPFNLRYQNCNQWVLEMLAWAWSGGGDTADARAQAQSWLKQQGYEPSVFEVGWRVLMWASEAIPWVHGDDHPPADLAAKRYRVSMPASIEAFVRDTVPGAVRLEFCHDEHQAVVHRGWDTIGEGCTAREGDTVVSLQP